MGVGSTAVATKLGSHRDLGIAGVRLARFLRWRNNFQQVQRCRGLGFRFRQITWSSKLGSKEFRMSVHKYLFPQNAGSCLEANVAPGGPLVCFREALANNSPERSKGLEYRQGRFLSRPCTLKFCPTCAHNSMWLLIKRHQALCCITGQDVGEGTIPMTKKYGCYGDMKPAPSA